YQALLDAGDSLGAERLAGERGLLRRAAPDMVPRESWFAEAPAPAAKVAMHATPAKLAVEGPVRPGQSLGRGNAAWAAALAGRGHAASVVPRDPPELGDERASLPPEVEAALALSAPPGTEVHVRHRWPPDFSPPASGHWVLCQPWEFGSLPKDWARLVGE